jgi:hypothetical protein
MVGVGDFDRFAFIVGAPRCGTTTLAEFLKGHRSVSFPFVKEPHFFSQNDLRGLGTAALRERVERDYLGRFFRADSQRRIGVDASVTYLYTPEQLEPILRLWPDSRFVIALRDPLSMLPSLHRRLIYLGDETIADFSKAWAAVPDRAAGRRIPRGCADPRWLRYDVAARFGAHLERLFAIVGRDRCHVILFDDLAADPAEEYRSFMDFIGVEPAVRPDFTARREGKDVRLRWLQRLLKRPPSAVREYFAGEHYRRRICDLDADSAPAPLGGVMSLRKRLLRWNRVSRPATPLPSELAAQIREQLEGDIQRLGQLLDRDLTPWLRLGETSPPGPTSAKSPSLRLAREALSH